MPINTDMNALTEMLNNLPEYSVRSPISVIGSTPLDSLSDEIKELLKDKGVIYCPISRDMLPSDNTVYVIPTQLEKPVKICYEGESTLVKYNFKNCSYVSIANDEYEQPQVDENELMKILGF